MKISIFTPLHPGGVPFLKETHESLKSQTVRDFEWVLTPNGGATVPPEIACDDRVKIVQCEDDKPGPNRIGRIKNFAAKHCNGDILFELDSDDLLVPNALEETLRAFDDRNVHMAYSNDAAFESSTWESRSFSEYWGWRNRDFLWKGHTLKEMISWKASPHMMRSVFWAPDHLRAWRAASYWKIGGHDASLRNADDHDLCCRFFVNYGASGIHHIDKCLYLYRLHGKNTCVVRNHEVQEQNFKNYCNYKSPMVVKWSKDLGLECLDLGGRIDSFPGFKTVDRMDAEVNCNLEERWPFEDGSVGVIRANHIFEHLRNPVHTMNEAYRVLAPGGWLFVEVPSTDGRGAFQDPTHISFWNENSFWYYTDEKYAKYIRPEFKGRFQKSRVATYFANDFMVNNKIPIVSADLIALKAPYDERPVGEVLI